jgi:hypothetical protein
MTPASSTTLIARRPHGLPRALVIAVGCGVLAARPALFALPHATVVLAGIFGALLVLGTSYAVAPRERAASPLLRSAALALGVGAFAVGRLAGGGHPPVHATTAAIVANVLAAVAEEAWFRRLCFDVFATAGTAYAIGASAALFAVVHVSIYGVWVLPLDIAAGVLLGWQRAATGTWTVPAVTHAVANMLVLW